MDAVRFHYRANPDVPLEQFPPTAEEAKALKEGKAFIIVYGKIIYFDVFGKRHWTQYCMWQGEPSFTYNVGKCTAYNSVDSNN